MATLSNTITPSNVLTATNTQTVSNKTFVAPILGTPASGNFSTGTFTWPTFNQNTTGSAATATTATNVSGGTASVTTLAASGAVTLSGGTANGVAYLNGSKVLTTGSALTFSGTDVVVDVPAASNANIYISGNGNQATNTGLMLRQNVNNQAFIYNRANADMLFGVNNTEGMRLTSTGSVVVSSSATYNAAPAVSTVFHVMSETAGDTINHVNYSGSSTAGSGYGMRTARGTAAAPAAVQVGDRTGAIFMGGYTGSAFVNSAVIQSNIDTGTVSASSLPTYMSFLTTPNNSIGRLERVRITSEGSVGVGTTTPGYSGGANRRYISIVGNGDIGVLQFANSVGASGNNGNIEWIDVGNTSSTSLRNAFIYSGSSGVTANNRGSFIALATKDDGVAGAGTERLHIDSLGNIGIGTSSPLRRLDIAGGGFAFTEVGGSNRGIHWGDTTNIYPVIIGGSSSSGTGYLTFSTNTFGNAAIERMRITSSGAISFGSTGTNTGTAGQLLQSAGSAASPTWITATNTNTASSIVQRDAGGAFSAGTITTTQLAVAGGSGSVTLKASGDITAYRSGGTTGVIFLNSAETRYLYWDGTNYAMPGAQLFVNGQTVLNSGNYTSYSPTLTGGSASGTWGISITGNAGTATALSSSNYINRTGSSGNLNTDFNNTPAGSTRIQGDDAGGTNGAGNSWWFYQNMRHSNGTNYWGTQVAWGWEDNANRLATRNVTSGSFGAWVYYLNSSNFGTYALPLSGGSMTGLIVGKISNTVDINAANDAGSISVRGDTTYPAVMSFHRGGAYAINVGLSTANNFVIGGWSASANAFVMTGGGALTMLNNITAYSDERVKTNWRDLRPDFIERLAEVKHGIYDRTDQVSTQVGVSAQSLQKILEQAVMENTEGHLSVAYGNAALVAAVKLAERVVALEARLAALEAKG